MWLDLLTAEHVVLVASEHSPLSEILICLEDFIHANLDRIPVLEIKFSLIQDVLSLEFDSGCLRKRDDGIL